MGFALPLMLAGLAGVAIPVLLHLLNRRRFDVVDWGAMQFLQVSPPTRRRLLLENLLLLALRMGLIAVLVAALAAPYTTTRVLADLSGRENRDVVLVVDGSDSMSALGTGRTSHEAAREWAAAFLDTLAAGDSVAILQAKQMPLTLLEPTHDLSRARQALEELPPPRGGCDWPQAVQVACKILAQGKRPRREIILLSDGQRFGWADEATLLRWELLAGQLKTAAFQPRLGYVNLDPQRPTEPANWSLEPLRASRAVACAGQQITFRTALRLHGQADYRPPHRLVLEVDGRPAVTLQPPPAAPLDKGQVPFSFTYRFARAGSHLISVVVEPDPPPDQRPADYRIRDYLPADNRQDLAIEVLTALPVLLVDGGDRPAPRSRGTDFLRHALAPPRDRTPAVAVQVVPLADFEPSLLTADSRPRVLVLADVPRLSSVQREAVGQFLAAGGGVLVTLGERVDAAHYNNELYRGGQGWLPARLDEICGSVAEPDRAASPLAVSFFHPALELFRDVPVGGLADARFPRWWKVTTAGRNATAVPVALLTTNDPLLVEKSHPAGRVLLCTVPLDKSWGSNLPDLPAFAPLAHELVYYLAGARASDNNLPPGQPLRYRPAAGEAGEPVLRLPDGTARPMKVGPGGYVHETTREPGIYRVETAGNRITYFVVQPDAREADLTPCTDADRDKVARLLPVTYLADAPPPAELLSETAREQELWGWFLLAVVGLLCSEVWLTRGLARKR